MSRTETWLTHDLKVRQRVVLVDSLQFRQRLHVQVPKKIRQRKKTPWVAIFPERCFNKKTR